MNLDKAVEQLWEAMQRKSALPGALAGQLTLADAYRVQLGILARRIAAGERLAGWKVGLSAAPTQRKMGLQGPVFGYLLQSARRQGGERISLAGAARPVVEAELCMTLGERLAGPGVRREAAMHAVSAVAPAFEIAERRLDLAADIPLGVADDILQWGFVTGEEAPYPAGLLPGDIAARLYKNGGLEQEVLGRDTIDDVFDSIAALANHLAGFGRALEAGQRVMTGTYTRPVAIAPGERWEARFAGIGTVSAEFA